MVKGLFGRATGGGQLNDEDWAIPFPRDFVPYSNTISGVDNEIKYWLADIGYDVWRSPSYKVAPFIGYAAAEQAHLLVQGSYKFGIGAAR
jgi:outer membrane protease